MRVLKYPENYWQMSVSCECGTKLEINRNDVQYNKYYRSADEAYIINCIVCRFDIIIRDLPDEVKNYARFTNPEH